MYALLVDLDHACVGKPQSPIGLMYSFDMPLLVLHWKLSSKLTMK